MSFSNEQQSVRCRTHPGWALHVIEIKSRPAERTDNKKSKTCVELIIPPTAENISFPRVIASGRGNRSNSISGTWFAYPQRRTSLQNSRERARDINQSRESVCGTLRNWKNGPDNDNLYPAVIDTDVPRRCSVRFADLRRGIYDTQWPLARFPVCKKRNDPEN